MNLKPINPHLNNVGFFFLEEKYLLDSFIGGLKGNAKPFVRAFELVNVATAIEYARLKEEPSLPEQGRDQRGNQVECKIGMWEKHRKRIGEIVVRQRKKGVITRGIVVQELTSLYLQRLELRKIAKGYILELSFLENIWRMNQLKDQWRIMRERHMMV